MGGQGTSRLQVVRLAGRQQAVVSRAQAIACGWTARRIDRALERGEIQALFPGVYLVGPIGLPHSLEMAAVLACGAEALLSHRSAAQLYGMLAYPAHPAPIDVTVLTRHRRRIPGIRCHRTTSLASWERREREGIPLTAPVRTILDLATHAPRFELERAISEAFALRLLNRPMLVRTLASAGPRRGTARLRQILDAGPKRTRSAPERTLLDAIRAADLPEPLTNHELGRWEVDFCWPDHRLVVEVDGYAAHSSPRAFERDRRKDAELADRGLRVVRISANQVRDDLSGVIGRLGRNLRERDGFRA